MPPIFQKVFGFGSNISTCLGFLRVKKVGKNCYRAISGFNFLEVELQLLIKLEYISQFVKQNTIFDLKILLVSFFGKHCMNNQGVLVVPSVGNSSSKGTTQKTKNE